MKRFLDFLIDIRWSFAGAIIVAIISLSTQKFDISVKASSSDEAIRILTVLCDACDPKWIGEDLGDYIVFKDNFKTVFIGNDDLRYRLNKFSVLSDMHKQKMILVRDISKKIDLLDSKSIISQIQREQQYKESLVIDWRLVLGWFITGLKISSVLLLVVFWWDRSYMMEYFPYKKWWFWIYMAVVFPYSLAIGLLFLISLLLRIIQSIIVKARTHDKKETYGEFCRSVMSHVGETRKQWLELLPANYSPRLLKDLRERLRLLEGEVNALNEQIHLKRQEYYSCRDAVGKLEDQSTQAGKECRELAEASWSRELERLIRDPHIRAVRIVNNKLEIYTSVFTTLTGKFGPVVIIIDPICSDPEIRKIDETIWGSNSGAGYAGFCFGNMRGSIDYAFLEKKPSDAVFLMFASFQSLGSY